MLQPSPVPYHATAVRPLWSDLPLAVRGAVEQALGAGVAVAESCGGGFTAGFASRVLTSDGRRAFVKAESGVVNPEIADCYRREAVVNAALPAGVRAPRVRWCVEADGWVVLGFDDLAGRMPVWPGDLDAVLALAGELVSQLTPAPVGLELATLAEEIELTHWRRVAGPAGAGGVAGPSGAGGVAGAGGAIEVGGGSAGLLAPLAELDEWTGRNLDVLAELEAGWVEASAGATMIHADLRVDNLLVDAAGTVWLCDWNWPCLAAPWLDLVMLLPSAHVAGLDADAVLAAHPVGRHADPAAVNAVLAAFAGMFIESAATPPPIRASPWLRQHQRHFGAATLSWLRSRLS